MVRYLLPALIGPTATALFVLLAGLLRRRLRHHPGLPAGPVRHVPGRRHPRPPADRLVRSRGGRPADHQRFLGAQGKPGTLTADAYRPALFTMVALLAVGFIANLLVRPVPSRCHEPAKEKEEEVAV
jgi:hypothetical protein